MNIKHILTASALAVAASGAFAYDDVQFIDQRSTLTRAEVRADLAQAIAAGDLAQPGETYGQFAVQSSGERSRDAVRAEARMAAHSVRLDTLYVGA